MPPWPARLHLGSPAPSHPAPGTNVKGFKSPTHQKQHFEDQYQDPPLHGVPVLAATSSTAPSPPKQKPRHARSHSNPFTSLFGNGKKSDRIVDAELQDDALDALGASLVLSPALASKNLMAGANTGSAQQGEKDLATGKCSTCDSTMQWSRHTDAFRCSVCLMINDRKPSTGPSGEIRTAERPTTDAATKPGALIKGKLTSYILRCNSDFRHSPTSIAGED